jgi:hypothetical protein
MAVAGDRMMALQQRNGFVRSIWDFIRIARLPGGGESRDIWKLGPLCIKRWSMRVGPTEVRRRCHVSRTIPACNSMPYVPWFHWTLARWRYGQPSTHDTCNQMLAAFPILRDLHPGNVVGATDDAIVLDFMVASESVNDPQCA